MGSAFGLYTHIQANRRRSAFLLAALFSLVFLLTFAGALVGAAMVEDADFATYVRLAAQTTLTHSPFVALGVTAWVAIAWRFNQAIIALAVPARGLARAEQPQLYAMLENLCVSRGMTMPKLAIAEAAPLNAFASGVNDAQYTITLTRGLIDALEPAEIEAVIAHELTHIRNGDVRMMVVAMIIAGVISFFCEMFFRIFTRGGFRTSERRSEDGKKGGGAASAFALAMLVIAIAWALSLMIRLMLSRTREYLADAGAVELTKNPDAMISALRKIAGKGEIEGATSGVMEMCLDNPRSGFADLFSSHPSIDDRIDALVKYAGGAQP